MAHSEVKPIRLKMYNLFLQTIFPNFLIWFLNILKTSVFIFILIYFIL